VDQICTGAAGGRENNQDWVEEPGSIACGAGESARGKGVKEGDVKFESASKASTSSGRRKKSPEEGEQHAEKAFVCGPHVLVKR